jgi:SNF2 family DNA or RNA helicase
MLLFRDYQGETYDWAIDCLRERSGAGLLLAPGLGKTGVVLRIADFMRVFYGINRVLVTAPAKVAPHWKLEAENEWGTVLPVHLVDGEAGRRLKRLKNKDGIFVISHAMLKWLSEQRVRDVGHFGMFVVDESSKFKTWDTDRTLAAKRMSSVIPYRIAMTGSPAPNSLIEMFPQQFILDRGRTLGSTIGGFRDAYCYRGGHDNRDWIFNEQFTEEVQAKIAPYWKHIDQSVLNLPPFLQNPIRIELSKKVKQIYDRFEDQLYVAMSDTPDLWAFNGAQKYNLCRQLASGGYYDQDKVWHRIHEEKIEVLKGLVEECPGPVLVAYQFSGEMEMILQAFDRNDIAVIKGGTSVTATQKIIEQWQQGQIKVLLAQSASISHGVNGLQHGGNTIVWFNLTNNADDHYQFNLRLHRSGQKNTVIVHYLLARGTVDTATYRIAMERADEQAALLEYFKTRN